MYIQIHVWNIYPRPTFSPTIISGAWSAVKGIAPRPCAPVLPRSHCLPGSAPNVSRGAKTWTHGELHDKNLGKGVELEPMNILKMLNELERAEKDKKCWPIRNLKIADSKMKKLTKERWIFTTGAGDVFCFEQSWFHENHLCCMCFMFFQVFPRRNPMAKSNFVSECRPHDWLKS